MRPGRIIRPIISFIILAAFFFILPVSCDDPNTNGGSTDGGGGGSTDGGGGDSTDGGGGDSTDGGGGDSTDGGGGDSTDGGGTPTDSVDVDADDDGLIDIRNLDMFDNIRLNLAGTSYNGVTTGGPTSATANCPDDSDSDGVFLCGYELMADLDFAQESSYALNSPNWTNKTWRPVDEIAPDSSSTDAEPDDAVNAGFPGIGAASGNTGGFNAIFEGNGKTISNFYSRNTAGAGYIGLFRSTDSTAQIRSLGVTNGNVYGGAGGGDNVGVLAGRNRGSIIASSASGSADGGAGDTDFVGGLVGNNAGRIIASYATGDADDATTSDADGGNDSNDNVGGLVGNNAGTITASYATGSADGGSGMPWTMSAAWWEISSRCHYHRKLCHWQC